MQKNDKRPQKPATSSNPAHEFVAQLAATAESHPQIKAALLAAVRKGQKRAKARH